MKLCKDCKNRGQKINCQFYNTMSNFAERCPYFEKGRQTNADRIRAMSDEELAEFLVNVETQGYHDQSVSGTLEMIDWLQSEVEG